MNKLPIEKRIQILSLLCEGSSMRSISGVCDVSMTAVAKLLGDAGKACAAHHDAHVRNVTVKRVQCDEIWSFYYSKAKNVPEGKEDEAGDIWTWTSIDADSKLILSYCIGNRDGETAMVLMDDLSKRLANRVQLTTDNHKAYFDAVEGAFGGDIDYAMLVKIYGSPKRETEKRYRAAECIGTKKNKMIGDPDKKHISTSYVERSNLSMRMGMRRFTRLTNAFSKKLDSHYNAIALYFTFYNFVRQYKTPRMSPAMAAGIEIRLWDMADIVALIDAAEGAPKKRGPYKKRER